jgi:hypothetical protein
LFLEGRKWVVDTTEVQRLMLEYNELTYERDNVTDVCKASYTNPYLYLPLIYILILRAKNDLYVCVNMILR